MFLSSAVLGAALGQLPVDLVLEHLNALLQLLQVADRLGALGARLGELCVGFGFLCVQECNLVFLIVGGGLCLLVVIFRSRDLGGSALARAVLDRFLDRIVGACELLRRHVLLRRCASGH